MSITGNVVAWRGKTMVDNDGDKVGSIEEIYLDRQTEQPEWALVKTGLFGSRSTFVPITSANEDGDDIRIPFTKSQVKDAPNIDADGELSPEEEQRLYDHYGMSWGDWGSSTGQSGQSDAGRTGMTDAGTTGTTGFVDRDDETTGMSGRDRDFDQDRDVDSAGTVGRDTSGPTTDNAMTRSEEELQVGTQRRAAGEARLRKYVVTENVTQTVPVQREEVRLEREPITDANVGEATSGPDISDEEHAVTLMEEEVVADKRVVPKERVRLDKDVVTEEREVNEDVRKERIEMEGDAAGTTGRLDSDRDLDSERKF